VPALPVNEGNARQREDLQGGNRNGGAADGEGQVGDGVEHRSVSVELRESYHVRRRIWRRSAGRGTCGIRESSQGRESGVPCYRAPVGGRSGRSRGGSLCRDCHLV